MIPKSRGPFFYTYWGGKDPKLAHHRNVMAHPEVCHGTRLANFWLHGSFLQLDDAKMAKSAGDFLRLQTVVERGYDPLADRLFCLSAHYHTTLHFSWEGLDGGANALHPLHTVAC